MIVGLFLQQAIALFVLKSNAGFSIFKWMATLASDFLNQALTGAAFFFDQEVVSEKHWFFVNTVSAYSLFSIPRTEEKNNKLSSIIFFIAFVQMMYYIGVMQWIIKNLYVSPTTLKVSANIPPYSAWVFHKLLGVSGAEAVVASASPWIGQGESACLVRPYVDCKLPASPAPLRSF